MVDKMVTETEKQKALHLCKASFIWLTNTIKSGNWKVLILID